MAAVKIQVIYLPGSLEEMGRAMTILLPSMIVRMLIDSMVSGSGIQIARPTSLMLPASKLI